MCSTLVFTKQLFLYDVLYFRLHQYIFIDLPRTGEGIRTLAQNSERTAVQPPRVSGALDAYVISYYIALTLLMEDVEFCHSFNPKALY